MKSLKIRNHIWLVFLLMSFIVVFHLMDWNGYYVKAKLYTFIKQNEFKHIRHNEYDAKLISFETPVKYKTLTFMRSQDNTMLYAMDEYTCEQKIFTKSLQNLQNAYLIGDYIFIETFEGIIQLDPHTGDFEIVFYGPIMNLQYQKGYFYFVGLGSHGNIYRLSLEDYRFKRLTRHLPSLYTGYVLENNNLFYHFDNQFFVLKLDTMISSQITESEFKNVLESKEENQQ